MSTSAQPMKIYDTKERSIRELHPIDGDTFRFYCCGPTVYGPAHIGNFRTFVVQDLFRRVLELNGTKTKHVRNLTDIDDKTIRQSQAEGKPLKEFTDFWTAKFHADCAALNLLPPHIEPSAVAEIGPQIALIKKLVERKHAYQAADGSVYFDISSFPEYGKLSHLDKRELKLGGGHRANESDEYEKDSMADFALWKARKPEDGENFWQSPWGEGRPGWHLECSAMSMKYLGESFDLHSGGVDLIFPHHENEIAQSEAATGKEFVKYWFHVTHLLVDGGKMSKSKGNLYTVEDIVERGYTTEELRYTLLMGHYRQQLNFTFDSMNAARQGLARIAKTRNKLDEVIGDRNVPSYEESRKRAGDALVYFPGLWEALVNDLNTPEALGKLFTGLKELDGKASGLNKEDATAARDEIYFVMAAFGFRLPENKKKTEVTAPEEIQNKAQARWEAKKNKDWATADALRKELTEAGWQIKDRADGYDLLPL